MNEIASRLLIALLVLVHVFLFGWAVAGLAEWLLPSVPWPSLANPLFPDTVLLLQWLFILVTACTFLLGYAARWRHMPHAVAVGYLAMAALCAVETVGFLRHDLRYLAMALEYAAYILILLFLFRSRYVRRRLGAGGRRQPAVAGQGISR